LRTYGEHRPDARSGREFVAALGRRVDMLVRCRPVKLKPPEAQQRLM
jgi:hypothetical protein